MNFSKSGLCRKIPAVIGPLHATAMKSWVGLLDSSHPATAAVFCEAEAKPKTYDAEAEATVSNVSYKYITYNI